MALLRLLGLITNRQEWVRAVRAIVMGVPLLLQLMLQLQLQMMGLRMGSCRTGAAALGLEPMGQWANGHVTYVTT
jgi:hypothetical protein